MKKKSTFAPLRDEGMLTYEDLDEGIRKIVAILAENGIETYESCEGGKGHSYPEPAVRFRGDRLKGFAALSLCHSYGVKVQSLHRLWTVEDGVTTGPTWEIVFRPLNTQPDLIDFTSEAVRLAWLPRNWERARLRREVQDA